MEVNPYSSKGIRKSRIQNDLVGERFGRLVVVSRAKNDERNTVRWNCICDCGNVTVTRTYNLKSGKSKSCGCKNREDIEKARYKHGKNRSKIYKQWSTMKNRCFNVSSKPYKHYGGRGIKVCDSWLDFPTYYEWAMMSGYSEGLSIDRIDNDGNYEPLNCRWVTQKTQTRNQRRNVRLTYMGETKTLIEWCEILGLKEKSVRNRKEKGIKNHEEILFGKGKRQNL